MRFLYRLEIYFLLFIFYSFCGWAIESTLKSIQFKRFVNRGFLIGPYCPIYGVGALTITILLKKYVYDPIALFVMSVVVCGVLEYFTSYLMEKLFHARWWDYSNRKFNINGRVCLKMLVGFGFLGLVIMYLGHPLLFRMLKSMPVLMVHIVAIVLFVCFVADYVISYTIMAEYKKTAGEVYRKDSSEDMAAIVRKTLSEKSRLHRRVVHAFPNAEPIKSRIQKRVEHIERKHEKRMQKHKIEEYEKSTEDLFKK